MKRILAYAVGGVLLTFAFLAGQWFGTYRIVTYRVDGYPVSYNRAWPTYGLPLADYASVLTLLRNNKTEEAIQRLDLYLDTVIYDAIRRRHTLRGSELEQLDRALTRVARYRTEFPRQHSNSKAQYPANLTPYWTADKQAELDLFLRKYPATLGGPQGDGAGIDQR